MQIDQGGIGHLVAVAVAGVFRDADVDLLFRQRFQRFFELAGVAAGSAGVDRDLHNFFISSWRHFCGNAEMTGLQLQAARAEEPQEALVFEAVGGLVPHAGIGGEDGR